MTIVINSLVDGHLHCFQILALPIKLLLIFEYKSLCGYRSKEIIRIENMNCENKNNLDRLSILKSSHLERKN